MLLPQSCGCEPGVAVRSGDPGLAHWARWARGPRPWPGLPRHVPPPTTGRRRNALYLLDLRVLQLDRRGAAEDRHRHLEPALFLVHLFDQPVERRERSVGD